MATFVARSNTYEGRYLELKIVQVGDTSTNKSTLNWTLTCLGGAVKYYSVSQTEIKINGIQVYYKGYTNWDSYQFPAAKGSVSGSIVVPHNSDGSKSVPVVFTTAIYTSAEYRDYGGTFVLDNLHKPPSWDADEVITEKNTTLTGLGIPATTITQFLSNKELNFTNKITLYDSATLSAINMYQNNILIGTSDTSDKYLVKANFTGKTLNATTSTTSKFLFEFIDNKQGVSYYEKDYTTLFYQPLSINQDTAIRRYTDTSTTLTQNKVQLTSLGTYYYVNNALGNANTVTIGYKVWKRNEQEPGSYSPITFVRTNVRGEINQKNILSNTVLFDELYYYKIRFKDNFSPEKIISGTIPTGDPVWTEYPDHVDFKKITVKEKSILAPYILYEGTLQGGSTEITLNTNGYEYLEIYYHNYSLTSMFKLDLLKQIDHTQDGLLSSYRYLAGGASTTFSGASNQVEIHYCIVGVDTNKTHFRNGYMGYQKGDTTNDRNNNENYYIYKIVGYK